MRKTLSSALNVYRQYRAATASNRAYKIIRYVVVFVVAVYLLLLTFPQILFAHEVSHKAFSFAQSGAPPSCAKHDSGNSYSSGHRTAIHFVEVCKVPNPEGKLALSVILSSDDGDHAIRVYSNDATKPLILDGIYVERNGEKKFISAIPNCLSGLTAAVPASLLSGRW